MSIFIDPEATFPISLKYREILNDDNKVIGIEVCKDDETNAREIVCDAKGRDYDTMSRILEESTVINHINAKPMINYRTYYCLIVMKFLVAWNEKDDLGNLCPISDASVFRGEFNAIRTLAKKWLRVVNGKGNAN